MLYMHNNLLCVEKIVSCKKKIIVPFSEEHSKFLEAGYTDVKMRLSNTVNIYVSALHVMG